MNEQTLAVVLGKLFVAAGRNIGDGEAVVWREALSDVRDDLALEAARLMVREQNLWDKPPTPAGFREVTRSLASRRPPPEKDDRALPPGADAVRSAHGWRVERRCGRCSGRGWMEVDQPGSHIAVTKCPTCEGTGAGNDLESRVTPPEEAKERLAELRAAMKSAVKSVDEVLGK